MSGKKAMSAKPTAAIQPAVLRSLLKEQVRELCFLRGLNDKGRKEEMVKRVLSDCRRCGNSSVDFRSLTKKQLITEALLHGLSGLSHVKKADIIRRIKRLKKKPAAATSSSTSEELSSSVSSSASSHTATDEVIEEKSTKVRAVARKKPKPKPKNGIATAFRALMSALETTDDKMVELYKALGNFEPLGELSEAESSGSATAKRKRPKAKLGVEVPGQLDELSAKLDDTRRALQRVQSVARHPPRGLFAVIQDNWKPEEDEESSDESGQIKGPIVAIYSKKKRALDFAKSARAKKSFGDCAVVQMETRTRRFTKHEVDVLLPPEFDKH